MLRGFYNAAAGMLAQQRKQEILTNNMANANTPGYKADNASLRTFPTMLLQHMGETELNGKKIPNNYSIGPATLSTGVYVQETTPNFLQGDMRETGIKTDVALLQGQVPADPESGTPGGLFFRLNVNGEERFTRNGHFSVDAEGNLVTSEGYYVLGTDGSPITVTSDNFSVNKDGTVMDNGAAAGQIDVAYIANSNNLVKEGTGLFRLDGNAASAIGNPAITYNLQQGFVERSNVNTEQTMTEMLTAYRAFEANQKVLQAYDRTMEKAANEIGRIG
ncbi:flagellar biosynthesis protein FlgC [Fictibacillus phosphorivorans]|uniref:Flagellar biosynthesis protein FlgC n=1 Tax=Fictibacillus phosphorivorans TaxID=1221500 RepID=A0A161U095_9BACL|nr:flagellar hook-basal body protein [Fictibacillus phosphorivorans]KZE63951.1 flagellar biosynthesis protein FlgC [Fictibacillus phosphorivorans]